MAGLLPPVIATLIADTKEYMAKMTEAEAKMKEFGDTSDTTGTKIGNFTNKASSAILGLGAAVGVYAVDQAYKFQESLDGIQNQTNLTKTQVDKLGDSIIKISDATGISTSQLSQSVIMIEQAGIKGKKAVTLLNDASEAAVITKTSVADTTKAIVAAQTLQIAKGMDVTKLTGILVKGSKEFVGGLSAEEKMLSGRVGVALANYGIKLKTVIPLGAEFAKVGLPTRSISSFVSSLGNLQKPLTDNKGKLTSYAQGLDKVGLSQQNLASDLRKGDIVGILTQIKKVAQESGEPLSQVANAVFGTSGGGTASVLVKNLQDLVTLQTNLNGAGATSLSDAFKNASQQLGPQLKIFETNLQNALIPLGKLILPVASDVLSWVEGLANAIKNHPLLKDILGGAAIATFALALAIKVKSAMKSVFSAGSDIFNGIKTILGKFGIGGGGQAVPLEANTTALENLTRVIAEKGLGGAATTAETGAAGAAGGKAVAAEGAAAEVAAGAVAGIAAAGGVAVIAGLVIAAQGDSRYNTAVSGAKKNGGVYAGRYGVVQPSWFGQSSKPSKVTINHKATIKPK